MKKILLLAFVLYLSLSKSQSPFLIGSTSVMIDTIFTGLDIPWEISYGSDNFIWTTERKGLVSLIDPVLKTKSVVLDLTASIFALSETGLLGLALHPNFATTKEVFLVYTFGTSNSIYERLVKYTYNNTSLINPQILIDSIPGAINHDGSRLLFMQDNTLLMSTGDGLNTSRPQDLNSKNGKILRVNTDGTIPSNNPFPNSYVYTYGHRNPQGLLKMPDGRIYESEHGPNNDDEFQLLESSRNYGWPNVEGFCDLPAEVTFCNANNVKEPIFRWTPTIAPADIVYYSNPGLPEFDDCVLMTVLKDKKLVALKLNASGTASVTETSYLVNQFGRLRDICIGPNKEIYIATNGTGSDANLHSIIVLRPTNLTGQNRINEKPVIRVYPTEVTGTIHIEIKYTASPLPVTLKIYDVLGKLVNADELTENITNKDMSQFKTGIYFLSLESKNVFIYKSKIVKTE